MLFLKIKIFLYTKVNSMKNKRLLITGGAGFIGSNFIQYWLKQYKDTMIVNFDKLTYAGDLNNLKAVEDSPNYALIRGDINNTEMVNHILKTYQINGIIHFAAESHVDNSIANPDTFQYCGNLSVNRCSHEILDGKAICISE